MENKNYLLLTRHYDGYIQSKVLIHGDIDTAKSVLTMMMKVSPKLVKGEIVDGDRDYIGDFRVRPSVYIRRDKENNFTEVTGW
jgi:hypothetical protein